MGHYQKSKGRELIVKMRLSRAEIQRMINEGLQGVALEIGLEIAEALLDEEVDASLGSRGKRDGRRQAYRHGRQSGWIRVGGVKAPISRPRVRSKQGREVGLRLYERMQDGCEEAVMRRVIRGVSCRNYRAVIDAVRKGYGASASAVSRSFVAASEARVRELAQRRFDESNFAAVFIDGVCFARQTLVVALGVTVEGKKVVLAMRQGATENATVCADLLEELRERGVGFEQRTLVVVDGSKALRAAVDRVFGHNAVVQRCQVHKLRNIQSYVSEEHWPDVRAAIRQAYAEPNYGKAKRTLEHTARWLDRLNPQAGASLREGLEETLTVTRLGLVGRLRSSFATTNLVEGLFSRVRTITGRVKRWRPGAMRERWCATGLLEAEAKFRAVRGCSEMLKLLTALGRTSKLSSVA